MPHQPTERRIGDHRAWQAFLNGYVVLTQDRGSLVRYSAVTAESHAALRDYLGSLAAVDPVCLDRKEQFAFWANLYNALTVALVLCNPAKSNIKRMGRSLLSLGPAWQTYCCDIPGAYGATTTGRSMPPPDPSDAKPRHRR